MPRLALSFLLLALPAATAAQNPGPDECAAQAALVMTGVEARAEGRSLSETREVLGAAFPDETAVTLAEWIFSLPEDFLDDTVRDAWRAQCEAL